MGKTKQQTRCEAQEGVSLLSLLCYGIGYLAGALFKWLVHIMRLEEGAQKYRQEEIPAFMRQSGVSLFTWQEKHLKPATRKVRLLGYERKLLAYNPKVKF